MNTARVWTTSGLAFCSTVGTPLSQRNVLRTWDRIVEDAGVEHRGFHHLRHTYGTALAERGVHERVAQELLGHADSRTTREIYTHTTSRMLDTAVSAVVEALDEAFGSPIGSPDARGGNGSEAGGGETAVTWGFGWRAGRDSNPRPSDP